MDEILAQHFEVKTLKTIWKALWLDNVSFLVALKVVHSDFNDDRYSTWQTLRCDNIAALHVFFICITICIIYALL